MVKGRIDKNRDSIERTKFKAMEFDLVEEHCWVVVSG